MLFRSSGIGAQLPAVTLLGGAGGLTPALGNTVGDVGKAVTALGDGVSGGLGQIGNIANPVGTTTNSLDNVVIDAGAGVKDLGTGVAGIGAATPINPITSGLGDVVTKVGSGVQDVGSKVGDVLGSSQANVLTQTISDVITPVAVSLGSTTSPITSTNLVAATGTAGSGIAGGLSLGVTALATDVKGVQAPGALGGLSQPVGNVLASSGNTLGVTSQTLGTGLGMAGTPGAAPVTKTLDGSANLVSSVAPMVSSLGTGGLSGLAPVTNGVAGVVSNVGTGVGSAVNSPGLAPVTNTLNTVVNNVASATGLSSTTGSGTGGGAGADPVSSLLGRLKDLGKGNHGL